MKPDLEVLQLIHTSLKVRGTGIVEDPYRRIEQYWTLTSELLFEYDSYTGETTWQTQYK